MKEVTSEKIKRLLFTDEPLEDETLYSYILRLARLNEITDVRWIYKLISHKKIYEFDYSDNFYYKIDLERLSKLTGAEYEKLEKFHFDFPEFSQPDSNNKIELLDPPYWHDFVNRFFPKICPACLAEKNYCRKIWELSFITTCPHHKCLLISSCPNCEEGIRWQRHYVNICPCGYDFRKTELTAIKENETKLSACFHKTLGLKCYKKKTIFADKIESLKGYNLLRFLCFITSHIYGRWSFSGDPLLTYGSHKKIHVYLNRAFEVIDDWPIGYHQFIRDLNEITIENYFLRSYRGYFERSRLPRGYEIYELINQLQRTILFEEQFSFIHEEFLKLFPDLPANNFDFENGLCFVNYRFIETPLDFDDRKKYPEIILLMRKSLELNPEYKDEFYKGWQ